MSPSSHPEPPSDLQTRQLLLRNTSQAWLRIYKVSNKPIYFGRTRKNRFDAPNDEFGVMYVANDLHGAFIETFGRSFSKVVTMNSLSVTGLARIHVSRELKLIDLAESGSLAKIGADNRLSCDTDYALTQRWSKALYDHPANIDGILYMSRLDPKRLSCALFDRISDVVKAEGLGTLGRPEHAGQIALVLDTYDWALIP